MVNKILINLFKPIIWITYRIYGRYIHYSLNEIIAKSQLLRVGKVGRNCKIYGSVTIHSPENLALGDHVRIGTGCFFFCLGGLSIGNNTQLSRNITIYTANHNTEGFAIPYDNTYTHKSVVIGENVWIGMNACITPGVKIGEGAIIGMGSVISKDVPPGAIVVGSQQRIVKYRNMDTYCDLKNNEKLFAKLWPNN